MAGRDFAYIRVSTADQNDGRQLADCDLDKFYRVYREKVSGKSMNRPELKECLSRLDEGDTLHVHSIDRLARSMTDLKTIVTDLTNRGVTVHFHKHGLQPFLPVGSEDKEGMSKAMRDLMLNMLASFAEFERELINDRVREGVVNAKRNGTKTGRPFGRETKLNPVLIEKIKAMVAEGKSKKAIAEELGVSRPTIYKALAAAAN